MDILTISQITVNFIISAAILVVGLLIAIIAYEAIVAIKRIKNFFTNLNEKSIEAFKHLDAVIAGMSVMPFISKLFKKHKEKKEEN